MIKVLLAEDHNMVRDGIRSLLEKEEDIQVLAEASNGKEVLKFLKDGLKPDIILTAINMPQMSGVEVIIRLKQTYPNVKVIVLTMLDDEKHVVQAFKAGATGYILKSANATELTFGIRHVISTGERFICTELSLKLLDKLVRIHDHSFEVNAEEIDISEREVEVLNLIAAGLTNQEAAEKLQTSKRTIESHRKSLTDKTGTRNTAALVRYAILNGIIS
ncbi:response regulator transcription factor [Mucilaginibacter glaciei]|uniref:Response regulator transcription factor n=1 Tax=Mucilaginibacter glaciei TaxID=2772109 RepID=A0A926NR32_9SPHI|nr:response regulator transcription factor [Mucilaginibacter glaciei]MBD1394456.1 response regulator transcription factor [Mucilaginibacter glaciei]